MRLFSTPSISSAAWNVKFTARSIAQTGDVNLSVNVYFKKTSGTGNIIACSFVYPGRTDCKTLFLLSEDTRSEPESSFEKVLKDDDKGNLPVTPLASRSASGVFLYSPSMW